MIYSRIPDKIVKRICEGIYEYKSVGPYYPLNARAYQITITLFIIVNNKYVIIRNTANEPGLPVDCEDEKISMSDPKCFEKARAKLQECLDGP